MHLHQLLHLLSDGQFHSGSELGDVLGLSRTSIWKALSHLQSLPVELETIKGRGYRIVGGLDLLDPEKIREQLSNEVSQLCALEALLICTSTNDYMASQSLNFSDNCYQICFAEQQTNGRGRRGRSWISSFAKNISLSIGFTLSGGVEVLSGMSLVVGVAMASALAKMGVQDCAVKWPNDVIVGSKKICGILIELQGEATTGWSIVCGVGLNVAMSKQEGEGIDQDWIALNECVELGRNIVAVRVLEELVAALEIFKQDGFSAFDGLWRQYDYLNGKDLVISPSNLIGRGVGVDAHGALLVDVHGKTQVVNAGEVSVRKL